MVSLFELMLANWPEICRTMMEEMHETWSVFCVIYKLTMGLAVIGVIFGVFTQETFKAAESDDQLMLRKNRKQANLHRSKLQMLFTKMSAQTGKREIDLKVFQKFLQNDEIKHWLKAMDYDTNDAELLFFLLDKDGKGSLTLDDVLEGMHSVK